MIIGVETRETLSGEGKSWEAHVTNVWNGEPFIKKSPLDNTYPKGKIS